jgi:hypothetical protein
MEFTVDRMPYDELVKKVRELIIRQATSNGNGGNNGTGGGIDASQIVTSLNDTSVEKVLSAATGQLIKQEIITSIRKLAPNVRYFDWGRTLNEDAIKTLLGKNSTIKFTDFPEFSVCVVGDLLVLRVTNSTTKAPSYLICSVISVLDSGLRFSIESYWQLPTANMDDDYINKLIDAAIDNVVATLVSDAELEEILGSYAIPDDKTLRNTNGVTVVHGIYTVNSAVPSGVPLKFFVGTQAEFAALADQYNVIGLFTDAPDVDAYDDILEKLAEVLEELESVKNFEDGIGKILAEMQEDIDQLQQEVPKLWNNVSQLWNNVDNLLNKFSDYVKKDEFSEMFDELLGGANLESYAKKEDLLELGAGLMIGTYEVLNAVNAKHLATDPFVSGRLGVVNVTLTPGYMYVVTYSDFTDAGTWSETMMLSYLSGNANSTSYSTPSQSGYYCSYNVNDGFKIRNKSGTGQTNGMVSIRQI